MAGSSKGVWLSHDHPAKGHGSWHGHPAPDVFLEGLSIAWAAQDYSVVPADASRPQEGITEKKH